MIHSLDTSYEQAEREMLVALASPGDILFDVGAYVGWYSVDFAQKVPKSMVYAFEPISEIHTELTRNVDSLDNIVCCPFGLSDRRGLTNFYISKSEPGTASMAKLEEERFGPTSQIFHLVTTIDWLCGRDSFPLPTPNIIKIDVEGAELLVLRGAQETLRHQHPIIQCEMLRKWAKRFKYHPNDIIAFLSRFGYQCYVLRSGKLCRFHAMTDETEERNFFFIHSERKLPCIQR